jgi:hypothetical protein
MRSLGAARHFGNGLLSIQGKIGPNKGVYALSLMA